MAYRNGLDCRFTKPNEFDKLNCVICGSVMNVDRGVSGPTSYAEAMFKFHDPKRYAKYNMATLHDAFHCPNSDKAWHDKAGGLLSEMEDTTSDSLRKLIKKDYKKVLKEKK